MTVITVQAKGAKVAWRYRVTVVHPPACRKRLVYIERPTTPVPATLRPCSGFFPSQQPTQFRHALFFGACRHNRGVLNRHGTQKRARVVVACVEAVDGANEEMGKEAARFGGNWPCKRAFVSFV